ncbi:DUF6114 domain-containing protein [Micromonospora parathelypteridis]|uniref:Uncharacterized protein n=1 Tax=Micromonospora parathelypteridis TaxID=1839617 RepID=A0A840VMC7_9ACTN|nr:DUF6114 domain-containing protein [Micromonospora parathelypteridis]MBB5478112.1 hypothetical protein [Micromonospora parathelypteridis]GGO13445.1 hypothetical protein GCM10011576_23560 [Micromonospora parathelypteridis]
MTTANPSHARPGGPAQAWRLFRRWQRSRPFWGGLLTALAGLEMFASTRMTLNGLSFHSGASGLLSLLIPVILVTCGLLLWFTPAQRLFYSVAAAVTAVYSLIGLNLGGFFVGLLLGIVGSALAFAWTPTRPAPSPTPQADVAQPDAAQADVVQPDVAQPDAAQADAAQADVVQPDVARADVAPGDRPTAAQASDEGAPPEWPGRSADPRAFGIVLVVLGLAAVGLAIQPRPVQAAPGRSAATACPTPSRSGSPSPSRSAATPTPTPSPGRGGNVITDILDGIGDLLGGGRRGETPTPSTSPTATPTTRPGFPNCPGATPGTPGKPGTTTPGKPGGTAPDEPGTVEPGKPLPRIAADPGLPVVAQTPSKLTGSSVRMTGLRFEGITDLSTVKGDLKVLKFSMREAVTDDFLLSADGPEGRNQRYATDRLTVSGDVAFYATRFVGRLLGIKVTLTPDLPLPNGIPITSPVPITFTDPVIDLAYVTSDTLTARPALALTLG